jgi:hypothetical protein
MLIGHLRMGSFTSREERWKRARALRGLACLAVALGLGRTAAADEPKESGTATPTSTPSLTPTATPTSTATPTPTPTPQDEGGDLGTDPSGQRPFYGVAVLGAELGTNYDGGLGLGLFGTLTPGVALGGWAYLAPLVSVPLLCTPPCKTGAVVLGRWMAELRLGTAYADYRKSLAWFGVGAGVSYESGLGVDPSPVAAVAIGGDLRVSRSVWVELSPRFTWTPWIGSGTPYAYSNFMGGIDLGVRFDFRR